MIQRLLRWRYDYADKPTKFGQWCVAGETPKDMALYNNKGIIRAAIEAKDMVSRVVSTVAEADSANFRVFRWLAVARIPMGLRGEFTPTTNIVGLSMWTMDDCIECYIDGTIKTRPLTNDEKKLH
jgi:hypothetical protein